HNQSGSYAIDVARVGDPADLPLGSADPEILIWAERNNRIVVSLDRNTLVGHLQSHLAAGGSSPGVFLIRPRTQTATLISFLALASYASRPDEWNDRASYVPP